MANLGPTWYGNGPGLPRETFLKRLLPGEVTNAAALSRTIQLLNSEFSTVSTFNPGLGSIYGPRACPAGATELSPGFQPWEPSK